MSRELDNLSDRALNGLNDWIFSHWFPTEKSSHTCAARKLRAMKDVWDGQGPAE